MSCGAWFRRIPGSSARATGCGPAVSAPWQRALRLARDLANRWIRPPTAPRTILTIQRVSAFGPEILPDRRAGQGARILSRAATRTGSMRSSASRARRCRAGTWSTGPAGSAGYAVLNVIPKDRGRTRTGKVVDCLLDDVDAASWHAAFDGPDRRAGSAGRRPRPGVRQHALVGRGPAPERLHDAVLGEVPHPRPTGADPARCGLPPHAAGGGLRIYVGLGILQDGGILHDPCECQGHPRRLIDQVVHGQAAPRGLKRLAGSWVTARHSFRRTSPQMDSCVNCLVPFSEVD